jgi:hypothetical protein
MQFKSLILDEACAGEEQQIKCFQDLAHQTTYLTRAAIAQMLRDSQV